MKSIDNLVNISNIHQIVNYAKKIMIISAIAIIGVMGYIVFFYLQKGFLCFELEWGLLGFFALLGLLIYGMLNIWMIVGLRFAERVVMIACVFTAFSAFCLILSYKDFAMVPFSLSIIFSSSRFIYKNEKKFAEQLAKKDR